MKDYFENDIKKLHILKKAFYVTLVTSITSLSLFVMSVCGFGIGKVDKWGTQRMKNEAVADVMNSEEYKTITTQMKDEYAKELAEGKITQGQYQTKVDYLSTESFLENVMNSETIKQYNAKIKSIEQGEANISKVAPISASVGGICLLGAIGTHKKREQIKKRWYDEEEARGL